MADYSWIFSTISQSTAAIAGLFGAFLLSKLLSRESEYFSLMQTAKQLKIKEEIITKRFSDRYFHWYNKLKRQEVLESEEFQNYMRELKIPKINALKKIIEKFNFSEFDSLELIKEKIEKYKIPERRSIFPGNLLGSEARVDLSNNLNTEYELIINLIRETEEFIENIKLYVDNIIAVNKQRKSFLTLLVFLILLMNIGVIYPLTFMPLNPGEIPTVCNSLDCNLNSIGKFYNLPTFSIIFLITLLLNVFMGYLIYKSYSIYFSKGFVKQFEKTMILENYSEYLKNRTELNNFAEN